MNYTWEPALLKGNKGEQVLDSFFSKYFKIIKPKTNLIDRIFVSKKAIFSIEYKTDYKAAETNNLFIETVANINLSKLGWVYTSPAQIIVFYIPNTGLIMAVNTLKLRAKIPKWKSLYTLRECRNQNYNSRGILVPIKTIKSISLWEKHLTQASQ
jgi:hypothetical protein